ncbi:MAG: tetratricopeptide repeat protein [Phycisphaerales bacterium]
MPIRTELYRRKSLPTKPRSARRLPRSARRLPRAAVLIGSGLLMAGFGGCDAIKERRAQRAERDARAQVREQDQQANQDTARQLPNQDPQQTDWLARQHIANGEADRSRQEPRAEQSESGMTIVDERTASAPDERPLVEIVEQPRRTREQQSYAAAVEMHAAGDLQAALAELERAIAFNPQFTPAYLESGDIYLELAQYEEAERQFALAVRNEPRNYMAQYRHAQVLHKLDRLDDANRAFLRALSIRPASFDANLGISIVLLEMGRAEQSLPYGQRAVRSEPPSGRARMHLGNVYAAIDRHEEAVVEYQQAAELMDAPTAGLLLNMAESLNQLQRYAEMVGALDQLVRIDPGAIAYERLGSGLFRLKRYEDSLDAFRESANLDPSHYPAFNGIAVCELNQYLWSSKTDAGSRERAVEAMRQSLRLNRDQPRIVELLRRYSRPSGTEQ